MLTPTAAYWLSVLWLLAIGGAVGSFLNVVIYRLPRGISIVRPPSRCPNCEKRIPWHDNVPVFGWLWLRGRCRQCGSPISARYPIVEAATALMFGAVAAVELPYMNQMGFYGLYPYHMLLLCTLLCVGLIEFDGNRPPSRLFLPVWVVGFAISLFIPTLRFALSGPEIFLSKDIHAWSAEFIDGWAGCLAGSILGLIAWGAFRRDERQRGLVLGLVYVGLFLGWQAVTIIAIGTAVLVAPMWLPEPVSARWRVPGSLVLAIVTLVWIVVWMWLVSSL